MFRFCGYYYVSIRLGCSVEYSEFFHLQSLFCSKNLSNFSNEQSHHQGRAANWPGSYCSPSFEDKSYQVVLEVKNLTANAGDMRHGFNPWQWKIPWRRAWQPLQYSCLENPMDRQAWWARLHRVAGRWTWLKRLNTHA